MSHTISVATVYPKETLSPGNTVAVLANTSFQMSSSDDDDLDDIANGPVTKKRTFIFMASNFP